MVRDNVTGLMWEVKTDDGSIHDKDNTYTWYDSNPATNGGNAGTSSVGTDTEDYINALNLLAFGGFSDWRIPSQHEIRPIADYSRYQPAIDETVFPYMQLSYYWSSTSSARFPDGAWRVDFQYGYVYSTGKGVVEHVRAVRNAE